MPPAVGANERAKRWRAELGLVVDNKIKGSNHVVVVDDKFIVLKTTAGDTSHLPDPLVLGSGARIHYQLTESYPVGGPVRVLSACVNFAAFPASTRVSSMALYFSVVGVSDNRFGRP